MIKTYMFWNRLEMGDYKVSFMLEVLQLFNVWAFPVYTQNLPLEDGLLFVVCAVESEPDMPSWFHGKAICVCVSVCLS